MRIAVAGSTGLMGRPLVERLTAGGHAVTPMVRRTAGPGEIAWDPHGTTMPELLSGIDAVVNLAGAPIGDKRWSEKRKRVLWSSRVDGTTVMAEAAAASGVGVLINASAIGFYGERGDEPVDESSEPGTGFMADLCQAWEAATAPAAQGGVRVVNLRSGIVLDPAGGALKKQLPLFRLGLGGRLGSGSQWMSWISIVDQVEAIVHLLEASSVSGPVNLVAPGAVRNAELTATLGRVVRRPAVLPVPRFALQIVLGEMVQDLLASAHVVPHRLAESGFEFRHPELEGALRAVLGR
jgi:hypothetical protein